MASHTAYAPVPPVHISFETPSFDRIANSECTDRPTFPPLPCTGIDKIYRKELEVTAVLHLGYKFGLLNPDLAVMRRLKSTFGWIHLHSPVEGNKPYWFYPF